MPKQLTICCKYAHSNFWMRFLFPTKNGIDMASPKNPLYLNILKNVVRLLRKNIIAVFNNLIVVPRLNMAHFPNKLKKSPPFAPHFDIKVKFKKKLHQFANSNWPFLLTKWSKFVYYTFQMLHNCPLYPLRAFHFTDYHCPAVILYLQNFLSFYDKKFGKNNLKQLWINCKNLWIYKSKRFLWPWLSKIKLIN